MLFEFTLCRLNRTADIKKNTFPFFERKKNPKKERKKEGKKVKRIKEHIQEK
jgi:hypothetical protein